MCVKLRLLTDTNNINASTAVSAVDSCNHDHTFSMALYGL